MKGSSIVRMILFLGIILFIVGIVYSISILKPKGASTAATATRNIKEGFQRASGYASTYTPSASPPIISRSTTDSAPYEAYQTKENQAEAEVMKNDATETSISAMETEMPDLGGLTEFDLSTIPWDADNRGVLPSTILWGGPIHSVVSTSIFAKQYGQWLAGQQDSISLDATGTNYRTRSPLFGIEMSVDNTAGVMASNIGEQMLIMYAQNEIFERAMNATRNNLLTMSKFLTARKGKAAVLVAGLVGDNSKSVKALDDLAAKLLNKDLELAKDGLEQQLPAGSFKRLFSTKPTFILVNPVGFITEPLTAALARRWPGSGTAIKALYSKLRVVGGFIVKFIEKCLQAIVAVFGVCTAIGMAIGAPLLLLPGGAIAAAAILSVWETLATTISMVCMLGSIVAGTVLAELPIANNVCPAGTVDLCAFLPSWGMMLITIVPILGDVISTLYPYMCWGDGGLTMKQPLTTVPSFYSNPAFTTSYFAYKPSPGECQDGSTLNSIAESGVCQTRAQEQIRIPGEGEQGCVITWPGSGNPHGNSYNGQKYVDFSDNEMLKRMAQFYYDNSRMNPLISYDLSGNKLVTYEMIYKIYGVAASSMYSGDIICDILYITYNPIDNSSYSETLSQFHDRRFYCYPFKTGTDVASDGLLAIQACTFMDGTAPEVNNTGIALGSDINTNIKNTVRYPSVYPTGRGSCIKKFTVTLPATTGTDWAATGKGAGLGAGMALFGLGAGMVGGKIGAKMHNKADLLKKSGGSAAEIRRLKLGAGSSESGGLIIGMGGAMGLSHIPLKPKPAEPSNTNPPSRNFSKPGDPTSDMQEVMGDGTVVNYGPAIFSDTTASGYTDGIGWNAVSGLKFCVKDVIQSAYCAQKDVLRDTINAYHTANPAIRIKQVTRIEARGVQGAPKHQACYYEWDEATYDSNTGNVGLATTSKSMIREYTITSENNRTCVYTPRTPATFYDAKATSGWTTSNKWYKNYMQPRYIPIPVIVPFSSLSPLLRYPEIKQTYRNDEDTQTITNDLTNYSYTSTKTDFTTTNSKTFLNTAGTLPATTSTTYAATAVSSSLTQTGATALALTSGEKIAGVGTTATAVIDIGEVYNVNSKPGTIDIDGSVYKYDTVAYPAGTAPTTMINAYRYRRERFYPTTGPFVIPLPSVAGGTTLTKGLTNGASNTTKCETPEQLQRLLDQFNEKSTSGGKILRVLRAFTPTVPSTATKNVCDLEVEMQRETPTIGVKVIQKETIRVTVVPDTVNTYPDNKKLYNYESDTAGGTTFDTGVSITAGTPELDPPGGIPYFTSFVQSIKNTYTTVLQTILNSKPEVTISGEVIAVDEKIKNLNRSAMTSLAIEGCAVVNFLPASGSTPSTALTNFYNQIAAEYTRSTGNTMTSILGIAIVPALSTQATDPSTTATNLNSSIIEVGYTYRVPTGTNLYAGGTTSSSSTSSRFTVCKLADTVARTTSTNQCTTGLANLKILQDSHVDVGQQYNTDGVAMKNADGTPIVIPSVLSSCGSGCMFSSPVSVATGLSQGTASDVDCKNSALLTAIKTAFEGLNGTGIRTNVQNTMDQVVQSFRAAPLICEYQIHKNSTTDNVSGNSYLRVGVGLNSDSNTYTRVVNIAEYNPDQIGWPVPTLLEDDDTKYTDGSTNANGDALSFEVPLLAGYDLTNPAHTTGSIVTKGIYNYTVGSTGNVTWPCSGICP